MKVEAVTRTLQGTGASRRLRRAGKVPAIVYGGTAAPVSIELDHNSIFHALRKEAFHSSILDLSIDGVSAGPVLLRDFQVHPYKQLVLHVDLQRVSATEKIHIKVPLHFVGGEESPAVKLGHNVISHLVTELEVLCLPGNLPEFISVDLSTLEAGVTLHASHLVLPEGVEIPAAGIEAAIVSAVATAKGASDEAAAE
ncbi:50S ribosomal protein L25/general stress protein Ctc [Derxia lacustris]|uniref:50S ribosomal protein L25/general stress protein Ctc n=1 Tax=Derxia lacustris TaxID=764842 RepID=UPI000A1780D8|nr:50S ribosomal protein L25/general stress protein Ctc [Derxia lacustris]